MKSLLHIWCYAFFIIPFSSSAQRIILSDSIKSLAENAGGCGSDALLRIARKNPSFLAREAQMNREILSEPVTLDAEFILPVVFHIVGDDPTLTTDAEIIAALNDLNDAFGKTGNYIASKGVDTRIRFCLAKKDPDGGITTGITRTTSFFGNDLNQLNEDARIKNLIQWDPLHYINIWYVRNIHYENFVYYVCGLVDGTQWRRIGTEGYATMPPAADSLTGIVVSTFGAVLAHEMGHYLGLYHTFEGGCGNNDCKINGDRVCDTPPDNSYLPSSCSDPANTCHTDTLSNYSLGYFRTDVPDQVANFMDYSNFNCSNEFTDGQAVRMRSAIVTQRSDLLVNKCNKPCSADITAGFTRDIPFPLPGNTISFTNTSLGANKYEWLVNDSLVSTKADLTYTFKDIGKYKVSLKAYSGSCFSVNTDYIIVTCGVTARFYPDKQLIASKVGIVTDSILFTNVSENASSYKWLIKNDAGMAETVVSRDKNLVFVFPEPGDYWIRLIASNGTCIDTTAPYLVPVSDPTPDAVPRILSVECYQQTKIRVEFSVCNSGYLSVKPGIPLSFFDADPRRPTANKIGTTFILPDTVLGGGRGSCCSQVYTQVIDVKRQGLNELYLAFNEDGSKIPIDLSDNSFIERNYINNVDADTGFAYKVSVTPPTATLEPGDSIQLNAIATPDNIPSSYKWTPSKNLSCTDCASTILTADSTTTKRVIASNDNGCIDTAYVDIQVPPAYDYTVSIDQIECRGSDDSVLVKFTVHNNFKRAFLPKGLPIAFYDANPITDNGQLLPPVFELPNELQQSDASFSTYIKGLKDGNLFAVVNDNGKTRPLKLPNTDLVEKNYSNNMTSGTYTRIMVTAGNSGPVCESDTVQLTASSATADAVFTWTGPAGFTNTTQNPVIEKTTIGNAGVYKVTASKNGCTSEPASTTVVVNSNLAVTAGTKDPVCENGSIHLTANSPTATRYIWTGPNGFTSSVQNPVITNATQSNAGLYTVMATSNACVSPPASVDVKINALPDAKFSGPDICLPSTTVTFKNESTISSGSLTSYGWDFGDPSTDSLNTSTDKNPVHIFAAAGKYLVSLTATSDKGCSAKTSNLYAGIHRQPVADFSNNKSSGVCANDPVVFTDNSIADNGTITKWIWEMGDGHPAIIQNTNSSPVTHVYAKDGTYAVTLSVTNDFGCEGFTSIPMKVLAIPTVDAGPDRYVLDGTSITLKASATGNGLTYLWSPATYLGNTTVLQPTVNRPFDDILYGLTVTSEDGCKASDQVWVKLLRKINIPNVFSPNGDGTNDVWNIRYLSDYPGCTVEIFDRYGKLVFRSIGYNKPWDGTRNGTPVPVGVYYYIIAPENGVERLNGSVTVLR
jgi:gliding motility-associated-like protein